MMRKSAPNPNANERIMPISTSRPRNLSPSAPMPSAARMVRQNIPSNEPTPSRAAPAAPASPISDIASLANA